MTINKPKLIESFKALDLAAGAINELYKMFLFADEKRNESEMMNNIAAQMGVLIQIRLKIYSDELNYFNTYYKKKNPELKQIIKSYRALLAEYNVELVRNIILAHNRHKKRGYKLTTAEDLQEVKMPKCQEDYEKLVNRLNKLHQQIFQTMIALIPELKD